MKNLLLDTLHSDNDGVFYWEQFTEDEQPRRNYVVSYKYDRAAGCLHHHSQQTGASYYTGFKPFKYSDYE